MEHANRTFAISTDIQSWALSDGRSMAGCYRWPQFPIRKARNPCPATCDRHLTSGQAASEASAQLQMRTRPSHSPLPVVAIHVHPPAPIGDRFFATLRRPAAVVMFQRDVTVYRNQRDRSCQGNTGAISPPAVMATVSQLLTRSRTDGRCSSRGTIRTGSISPKAPGNGNARWSAWRWPQRHSSTPIQPTGAW
jgi:hypothetical protein